ncbi:17093_t:CDS:1 [Racocetra persica]|uniref:17093_t:CDS:1 n=1 Tax=Racocetra persica TaxID=160502 RepID=A0ACA9RYG1_9GLOM|nr:17093_t:CDS:1 [Racocetra persica]
MTDFQMLSTSEILQLNIEELVPNNYKDGKGMNAFFLYRREFTKRSMENGIKAKMTDISKCAGQAWKNEKPRVKRAYAKVSKRIDELLQKRKPKTKDYPIIFDEHMKKVVQPHKPEPPIPIPTTPALIDPPQDEFIYCTLNVDDITLLYLNQMPPNYFAL